MDSLELTKIVGAILTAGIVASLSGFVASEIQHAPELEQHAYVIAPTDEAESTQAEASEQPGDLGSLLAQADPIAGQKVMKKCSACHTVEKGGANRIGPNLWNLINRTIASAQGFAYSSALQEKSGEAWSFENLDGFLAKPKDWAPGTKMAFAGIKKPGQRADLLAFLRTLSEDPATLPN